MTGPGIGGKRKLTETEISKASALRLEGQTWRELAARFGVGEKAVRRALDPAFDVRFQEYRRRANAKRRGRWNPPPGIESLMRFAPSAEALAERERAFAFHDRPVTAELMGDPLPGRSALDRQSRIA